MSGHAVQLSSQPDHTVRVSDITALEALGELGVRGLGRVVAVRVNGAARDLSTPMPRAARSLHGQNQGLSPGKGGRGLLAR